jgi:hypothetical protein
MNDERLIQHSQRPNPASNETGDTPFDTLSPGNERASRADLASSPLSILLDAAGHGAACIQRVKAGNGLGCSCQTVPRPLDDAATAVGVAIRFAQIGAARQVPIPRSLLEALVRHVDARNPAAILVWEWLAGRGQVLARADVRPKLRLVCEDS